MRINCHGMKPFGIKSKLLELSVTIFIILFGIPILLIQRLYEWAKNKLEKNN